MVSHAIVIGIDRYDPAIGPLDGAVHDALDFAAWVTRSGGVPAAHLRLLLEPDPAAQPPVLPAGVTDFSPVSSRGIRMAIEALRKALPEEGGKRLYFYYAGHGASIPEWQEDPVLIPPEFVNPRLDSSSLLGFKDLFHALGELPFAEQICLIDACRDFGLKGYEPVIPSGVRRRLAARKGRQYVLYSVAPGQKAAEGDRGGGVWTRALLDGLEGRDYRPVTPGNSPENPFEVRLDNLADWIRGEVEIRLQRKFLRDAARYVQTPEYDRDRQGGDPLMVIFTETTVPRAKLRVFVEPPQQHRSCRVSVVRYVPGLGEFLAAQESSPPELPVPVQFENLIPVNYSIRAETNLSYESQVWSLSDPPVVRLTLRAEVAHCFDADGRMVGAAILRDPRRVNAAFGVSNRPGRLAVFSYDAMVRCEALDAQRRVVHSAAGGFFLSALEPGIYRIRLSLPGAEPSEETVEVLPGALSEVRPRPPSIRLGASVVNQIRRLGVTIAEKAGAVGFMGPSQALGPVAGVRLASFLAFASCAAQQPAEDVMAELLSVGVRRFDAATSGLLVLVGSGADKTPAEQESFLKGCHLGLRHGGGLSVDLRDFERLSGLAAAAQQAIGMPEPGVLTAELHLPGLARTRSAIAILPGSLTVFIAVAEADGTMGIQQHVIPLPPGKLGPQSAERALRSVRRLGVAMSFFALDDPEAALAVLEGQPWNEPLLGCLAGYSLVRTGQAERFTGILPSLLRSFPDLPDLHVLAGLCDSPERQGEHFDDALRCGLPIFVEGLRSLARWFPETPDLLAEPLAGLLPGSPWTSWLARSPW